MSRFVGLLGLSFVPMQFVRRRALEVVMRSNRLVLAVCLNACVLAGGGCDEPFGEDQSALAFEDAGMCDADGGTDAETCVASHEAGIAPLADPGCPYDDEPCGTEDALPSDTPSSRHERTMRGVFAHASSGEAPIAIDARVLSTARIASTLEVRAVERAFPWAQRRGPSIEGTTLLSDLLYALESRAPAASTTARRRDPLIAWRLRITENGAFSHGETLWVWQQMDDERSAAIRGISSRDGREMGRAHIDTNAVPAWQILDPSSPLLLHRARFREGASGGQSAIALDSTSAFSRWLNENRPWDAVVDGDRIVGHHEGELTLGSLLEARTLWRTRLSNGILPAWPIGFSEDRFVAGTMSIEAGVTEKVVGLDVADGSQAWSVALRPPGRIVSAAVDAHRAVVWSTELTVIDTATGMHRFLPLPGALVTTDYVGLDRVSLVLQGMTAYLLRGGTLVAVDLLNGHVRFVRGGFISHVIAANERTVFAATLGGTLLAIDVATGAERWSFGIGSSFEANAFSGRVVVSVWRPHGEDSFRELIAFDEDASPVPPEHALIVGRVEDFEGPLSDLDMLVGDVRTRTDRHGRFRVRVSTRGAVRIAPLFNDGFFVADPSGTPATDSVVLDGSRRYVVPTLHYEIDDPNCAG